MTKVEFTNTVELAISEFTIGAISADEFRASVLNTLIYVATPHLKEEPDVYIDPVIDIIKNLFKPSDKDNGTFYTVYDIIQFIMVKTGLEITHMSSLKKYLQKLKFEETAHRKPYSRTPQRGYWLIVKE